MPSEPSASCPVHPSEAPIGLCVSCRRPMCHRCSTQVDGRHLCASCWEREGAGAPQPGAGERPAPREAGPLAALAASGALFAALWWWLRQVLG